MTWLEDEPSGHGENRSGTPFAGSNDFPQELFRALIIRLHYLTLAFHNAVTQSVNDDLRCLPTVLFILIASTMTMTCLCCLCSPVLEIFSFVSYRIAYERGRIRVKNPFRSFAYNSMDGLKCQHAEKGSCHATGKFNLKLAQRMKVTRLLLLHLLIALMKQELR